MNFSSAFRNAIAETVDAHSAERDNQLFNLQLKSKVYTVRAARTVSDSMIKNAVRQR